MHHFFFFKNSEHDQEIPESQTADKPMASRERATDQTKGRQIKPSNH